MAAGGRLRGPWATNGILQGCPLWVVLINALMGVWRAEINSLCEHMVVTTRSTPPPRGERTTRNARKTSSWSLGRADVADGRYANDTEAVAPDPGALQQPELATEWWLGLTGQAGQCG